MNPSQCSAARKLLGWSARELGRRCDISAPTILSFERGENATHRHIVAAVKNCLENAGVEFIDARNPKSTAEPYAIDLTDGSRVQLRNRGPK
ncbi:MAG: helix-turn-helix domain-containing protein [Nannocystaceae bacterium]